MTSVAIYPQGVEVLAEEKFLVTLRGAHMLSIQRLKPKIIILTSATSMICAF
jgi:hypothetical protein